MARKRKKDEDDKPKDDEFDDGFGDDAEMSPQNFQTFFENLQNNQLTQSMQVLERKQEDIEFLRATNRGLYNLVLELEKKFKFMDELEVGDDKKSETCVKFFKEVDEYVELRDTVGHVMFLRHMDIHAPLGTEHLEEKDTEDFEPMEEGDNITCPLCKLVHEVSVGVNPETNMKDNYTMFALCEDYRISVLCGMFGRNILPMFDEKEEEKKDD